MLQCGHVTWGYMVVMLHGWSCVTESSHVTMWSCYMGLHGGHVTLMVMLHRVAMLQCGHVTEGYMDGHVTEMCHVTMWSC